MHFDFAEALFWLERTPETLTALVRGLPESWLSAREGKETWCAKDVVGHLVHGEDTDWLPRARHILEHGEREPFPPFDRFAQELRFKGFTMEMLLERFRAARAESLSGVRALRLTAADFERRGRHPALGTVTMANLFATWVVHDLTHLAQIERVFAKRLAADVGPWAEYLPLLTR